jgi:Zn-dependent M28 family amino/carboxypeptidase
MADWNDPISHFILPSIISTFIPVIYTMKPYLLISLAFFFSCSSVKKTDAQATASAAVNTPADSLLLKDLQILSSNTYEGRKTGTKGAALARNYIAGRFKEIGIKSYNELPNYEQAFSFETGNGKTVDAKNIIGYILGKSDTTIVISAHYDHLGIIKNEVYNGADDNASGVAGLLKIATYFAKHKPNNTLIFAAFDAEEMGLQGAKAFVADPPIALSKIKLNINMDMIGHNDKGELYACGTYKYPGLKKYFITSNPNVKVLFGHDDPAQGHDNWTNQSDQGAFNQKNIPFIYFGVEDHKDYHKASDEYDNINKAFFIGAADSILEIVINIDKERDSQKMFQERLQMKRQ